MNQKKKRRLTEWDLELRRELHRLADLDYATCGRVVEEALEMQHENRRQRFDEDLLARFARTGRTNLHGLRFRDM